MTANSRLFWNAVESLVAVALATDPEWTRALVERPDDGEPSRGLLTAVVNALDEQEPITGNAIAQKLARRRQDVQRALRHAERLGLVRRTPAGYVKESETAQDNQKQQQRPTDNGCVGHAEQNEPENGNTRNGSSHGPDTFLRGTSPFERGPR